jgi:hypothetical protein
MKQTYVETTGLVASAKAHREIWFPDFELFSFFFFRWGFWGEISAVQAKGCCLAASPVGLETDRTAGQETGGT